MFGGDSFAAGLFLGSAVHDTSQVAGAGMVYQDYYRDAQALNVATVTKLERNLSMLVVIPLMAILYHRRSSEGSAPPPWYTMVPLFVIGFACMSALRTIGDLGTSPFGLLTPDQWHGFIKLASHVTTYCLGIAMAGVGLGTSIKGLKRIGFKPLGLGPRVGADRRSHQHDPDQDAILTGDDSGRPPWTDVRSFAVWPAVWRWLAGSCCCRARSWPRDFHPARSRARSSTRCRASSR